MVFKGSQSIWDWFINLACYPKKIRSGDQVCHVHWGYYSLLEQNSKTNTIRPNPSLSEAMNTEFMQASEKNVKHTALTLYQQIESALLPLIAQGKRVTFTGHSSGGAMAILVAHRLYQHQPSAVKRIVTFGQPATGFWNFKQHYPLAKRTYRICCDLDIVTFLPPIPFMFWHVGKVLWLHNGKIYEDTPTLVRLYRSIISWVLRPITYHYMNKYIRNKDFFDKH